MVASTGVCTLCRRVTKRGTNEHHLIPRTCHSNKWFRKNFTRDEMRETIEVCHDCHAAIHRFVPEEKTLGRDYHSVEKLLAHEGLAGFIAWVRKQR